MSAYAEGVALIAHDVLSEATTWNDLADELARFAEGWGVSIDTVGDDVLTAMALAWKEAVS